jgi:peptidoglycan-associated lipoprotein
MKMSLCVLAAAAVLGLAGCNRGNTLPDSAAGDGGFSDAGSSTSGVGDGGGIGVTPLTPEEAERQRLLGQLVVYFDYDQADIRPEFTAQLQAHAQNLARNANVQLRLEGHADERGSREYNIGLGERRAQAVRRVLMLQGAAQTQITTVSYGEERPAQTGTDEESWRLNRRVELVYR